MLVAREDGHWLADVPDLVGAHTYARSLPILVIMLAADLPDEAMSGLVLDYRYENWGPGIGRQGAGGAAAAAAGR